MVITLINEVELEVALCIECNVTFCKTKSINVLATLS